MQEDVAPLAWKCCGAGQFIGELELGWVPFHGSSNEQFKRPLQMGLPAVCFGHGGRVLVHINDVLIYIILFRVGRFSAGVGRRCARPTRPALQEPSVREGPEAATARPVQEVCVTGGGRGPLPRLVHQAIHVTQLLLLLSLLEDTARQPDLTQ